MKKRIFHILYLLTGILLWALLIPGLFFIAPSAIGIQSYTVLSGSMEPVIPTGGIVMVNTHRTEPAPGDIVTYQNGQVLVTHRVISVTDEGYITAGDANDYEDSGVRSPEEVIGTVQMIVPYLGYLIVYLQSGKGKLLIGILLSLYILLWGIQKDSK